MLAALCLLLLAGDPALEMVEGIKRYFLSAPPAAPHGTLAERLGVVDPRVPFTELELTGTPSHPPLRAETRAFRVYSVRWPVLEGVNAEGLLFQPRQPAVCHIVALPDADGAPEQLQVAQRFATAGCKVLAPALIDTQKDMAGHPAIRMTPQTNREFLYRMAFGLGRHPLGYEVQKTLAAVDWFAKQDARLPIGAYGEGEGAIVARYAAAIDQRITGAELHLPANAALPIHEQPIWRNVFALRTLTLREAPLLKTPAVEKADYAGITAPDAAGRRRRQFHEIIDHLQRVMERSDAVRAKRFAAEGARLKDVLWDDVFGRLPVDATPPPATLTKAYSGDGWDGYDVRFPVAGEIFGYGVLLVPRGIAKGERRAAVVVQHGLEGRPQSLFGQTSGRARDVYRNFGATLAERGYVVYLPQNPYIHDFRPIVRIANPLGYSLYSAIVAQYQRMLAWLRTLETVDPERIGYYGLSYGGKTAMRAPLLTGGYKAVVCAGDFNEWIRKLSIYEASFSYVYTIEYELIEWNLAHTASYAEMAQLLAPTPFMVERGHRDGVGTDEWVSYEYAKVRRYYDENGWGDRTGIAFFNGPHRVDGPEVLKFFTRWLDLK